MSKADAAPTPKQAPASGSAVPSPDGGDGHSKAAGKTTLARPKSFADTLAGRPERSLAERYNIEPSIPEDVIEWTLKCFGYFDASTSGWSKDIIRDPLLGEMDLWEVRESLFLGGRHDVNDDLVVEMLQLVGKVEHTDVRVNFREYALMCFKAFFEEPPEDDEASDVRDAFEILGGGPGKEGQVSVDKLKSFASSAQLTIDVDKFVGEVDEDGSGLVDYDEFCKLFADSKIDTNLHDTGEIWLRTDKDEILAKDPVGGARSAGPAKRGTSPTSLTVDTNESGLAEPDAHGKGRPDSAFGAQLEQLGSTVSMTRYREGYFGDDTASPSSYPGAANLHAPKMKKVLQSSLPKFDRRIFANSVETKCRRGWRCTQMGRNNPRNENGYNYYNVKPNVFQEIDAEMQKRRDQTRLPIPCVKMRKRGAEYTVKEHASQRMNVRLSSEMRCLQLRKSMSRGPSRAATAMGGSLIEANMFDSLSHSATRPQTVPEGQGARQRNVPALTINTRQRDQTRGIAEGLVGSRGLASSWGGSALGTTRNYSYKDLTRPKHWQSNMRVQAETPDTTQLLSMAAHLGLYDGRGYQKDVGPGVSFFNNSPH